MDDIRISQITSVEAEQLHNEMLSDFQKENFARYHANPFPLQKSAVAICFFKENDRLKIIMIERTQTGKHAGQMAFPGGKAETTDADLAETAIRETFEEVGIRLTKKNIIGELSPVEIPVSKFVAYPFVVAVDELPDLTLSENEVSRILKLDFEELSRSKTTKTVEISGKQYEVPCFYCQKKVIWGASSMIINELISRFSAPTMRICRHTTPQQTPQ